VINHLFKCICFVYFMIVRLDGNGLDWPPFLADPHLA
jgi:hypothetical protein